MSKRFHTDSTKLLESISQVRKKDEITLLQNAIHLYGSDCAHLLQKALILADILFRLELDIESLKAALIYPLLQDKKINSDQIIELFGEECNKLLLNVVQMQVINRVEKDLQANQNTEHLRNMLLAMATDIRAVFIILAERLWLLHDIKENDVQIQKRYASQTLKIHAPLANRLGVWQLKWELEDLALRYLKPDIYAQLAKSLSLKRDERETYIKQTIDHLNALLKPHITQFEITGRVKHIYSIYNKMQRKNANFEEIYDISAFRVLVANIDDCYRALSILQNNFETLPQEFDDYISRPKPNGYRSIHLVAKGLQNKIIEIQIRSFQMHQESELGVAAHWNYKEGILHSSDYGSKIALLRELVAWQKEIVVNETEKEKSIQDLFNDRVYVFTPAGDIIALENGATPLDFAYHIHSEIGHRCRGAKVNGNIVPLTYHLQTGERVEILTTKIANPSRDWSNPQLGYLKTARARSKVLHWYRVHDASVAIEKPVIVEKETLVTPKYETHYKPSNKQFASNVKVAGVHNLQAQMAKCCKPLPGDSIVGFVTQSRGLSIHKIQCRNIVKVNELNQKKLIETEWVENTPTLPVNLQLIMYDHTGLLRDLTSLLASEKIDVLELKTQSSRHPIVDIFLKLGINTAEQLSKVINKLSNFNQVVEVRRL